MHIYFLVTTNTCAPFPHFPYPTTNTVSGYIYSMSTAYLVLLFFLCISLQESCARHLSPLNKKLEEKSHFSIKGDDNKNGFDSPKQVNEGNHKTETRLVGDYEKQRNRRSSNHRVNKTSIGKASGALQKSLVSVSWRVPHNNKKPRQKHPGFDLDYSPPKTHPPHHN